MGLTWSGSNPCAVHTEVLLEMGQGAAHFVVAAPRGLLLGELVGVAVADEPVARAAVDGRCEVAKQDLVNVFAGLDVAGELPPELLDDRGEAVNLYALSTALVAAVQKLMATVNWQDLEIAAIKENLAGGR